MTKNSLKAGEINTITASKNTGHSVIADAYNFAKLNCALGFHETTSIILKVYDLDLGLDKKGKFSGIVMRMTITEHNKDKETPDETQLHIKYYVDK